MEARSDSPSASKVRPRANESAIEKTAADWLARRDSGFSAEETLAFEAWRGADPRHREAVQKLEATWQLLDRPRSAGVGDEVLFELNRLAKKRRHRRLAACASAFVVAITLGIVWRTHQ